jgi:hypothetical protein
LGRFLGIGFVVKNNLGFVISFVQPDTWMTNASNEKSTGAIVVLSIMAVFLLLVLISSIIDNFLTGGYSKKSDVARQEQDSRNEIERILDSSDVVLRGSTRAVTMRLQQLSTTQSSELRNHINQTTTHRDEAHSSEMTKLSSNIDDSGEASNVEKQIKIDKEQYSNSSFRNLIN